MSLLGLIPSAITGIMSGIQQSAANKARKKMNRELDIQQSRLDNLFNAEYYGDYMNRADVQNLLSQARKLSEDQNRINTGIAVVSGATPETTIAMQKNISDSVGNTVGNIAANAANWKNSVLNNYLAHTSAIQDKRYDSYRNSSDMFSTFANNNLNAAAGGFTNYLLMNRANSAPRYNSYSSLSTGPTQNSAL